MVFLACSRNVLCFVVLHAVSSQTLKFLKQKFTFMKLLRFRCNFCQQLYVSYDLPTTFFKGSTGAAGAALLPACEARPLTTCVKRVTARIFNILLFIYFCLNLCKVEALLYFQTYSSEFLMNQNICQVKV